MDHGRSSLLARAAGRLRSLLGPRDERLRPGSPRAVVFAPNLSGEYVGEHNVLSVTSAWAAVNAVTSDVSTLPLRLKRRRADGSSSVVRAHPAARLFARSPDGGSTTTVAFWRAMTFHLLVSGRAFARISREVGWPARLVVLDPATVQVVRDEETGEVSYTVRGEGVPADQVLHIVGLSPDGASGISPTESNRQTLGLSRAVESHASSYFGNGAEPGGFFTIPGSPSDEKVKEFRANISAMHGGARKHTPGVLSAGVTYNKTGSSLQEAQALELRAFQILEACRIWRLSPHKLGDFSKASYASVEQANLAHVTETLRPLCETIEAALNLRLLTDEEAESGLHFEFDLSAYLRADTTARGTWIRNMAASGAITIDEARAVEGLPPLPDGKGSALMVPLNTAPLDQVLAPPADPTTPPNEDPADAR